MKPRGRLGTYPLHKVSDLIDDYSGQWKIEVVHNNFLQPDAEAILNITLNPAGGEDTIAWASENSGIYMVKLAYRSLMTHNEPSSP